MTAIRKVYDMNDRQNTENSQNWQHFNHAADIGIRGIAKSLEHAFEYAAYAMTAVMIDPKKIPQNQNISIIAQATDLELLLVDWLSEIIYLSDTKKMLFSRFKVQIDRFRLKAQISGAPISKCSAKPAVEVKGVTYAELLVKQNKNGLWIAQCVLDV